MIAPRIYLLLWVVVAAGCSGVDPAAELAAAKADLSVGDLRTASVRLSNVVQAEPNNAEARILRGQLGLAFGDFPGAVAELERARASGAAPEQIAVALAEAVAQSGDRERAIALLDESRAPLEKDPSYWIVRAEIALQRGDARQATEDLARAEANGAVGGRYDIARSRVALAEGDAAAAEALLAGVIDRDTGDADAHLALGEIYARASRFGEATSHFERAADLYRENGRRLREARALLSLVQLSLAQNNVEAAASAADALVASVPQAAITAYVRGLVQYRQGQFDTAAVNLQNAVNSDPDNVPFLTLLAATQLALGNLGQAEQHLLRVLAVSPRDPAAVKLLAETRLRQQRPDAALQALQPLAALNAEDAQIGLLTGLANVLAGNPQQGVVYLEQAAALDPGNQLLKIELARAYSAAGRFAEAAELLGSSVDTSDAAGVLQTRLLELLGFARAGDRAAGDRAAEVLVREHSQEPRAFVVAALYQQVVNEPLRARELLETAVRLDGRDIQARLLLAAALSQEGRAPEAKQQLLQVTELDPTNSQALTALAQMALLENDVDGAEAYLGRAAADPERVVARLMLAQLHIVRGNFRDAGLRLAEADAIAPRDPEVSAVRGLLALAEGRVDDAVKALTDAQSRLPQRLGIALALADAYVRSGNAEQARSVLRSVLEIAPQSLPLRMALGVVELRLGRPEQALSIAKTLRTEFPQQRHGYLLEAQVEIARRRYKEAAAVARLAYEQEPVWPILAELVGALQLANERQAVVALLEEWVSKQPADIRGRLALANALQQEGRDGALAQYEAVLGIDANNVVALNNAAWLSAASDPRRALAFAERAVALAPATPAVLDTLGMILLQQNREQDAIGHLQKAAELAPQALDIRYHLARAQAELGRTADAAATLEALLQEGRPFDQRAEAETLRDNLQRPD